MSPKKPSRILRLGLPKGSLQETTQKLFGLAGFKLRISSALVLSRDRRSRDRVHPDPRAGDGALRRAGHPRRGHHGRRLDDREPREGEGGGRSARALAQLRPGALDRGGEGRLEDQEARRTSKGKRIATEVMNLTKRYLKQHGVKAESSSPGARPRSSRRARGRDRRRHRDRLEPARQQPARDRHRAREHAALHREPGRLRGRVEAQEDRADAAAAEGARSRGRPRRADDERAEATPRPVLEVLPALGTPTISHLADPAGSRSTRSSRSGSSPSSSPSSPKPAPAASSSTPSTRSSSSAVGRPEAPRGIGPATTRSSPGGASSRSRACRSGAARGRAGVIVLDGDRVLLAVRNDLRGWELPGGNLAPVRASRGRAAPRGSRGDRPRRRDRTPRGRLRAHGLPAPHGARLFCAACWAASSRPSSETPLVRWFPLDGCRARCSVVPGAARGRAADPPRARRGREHQGLGNAILAGMSIDLRMRLSDRPGRLPLDRGEPGFARLGPQA